MRQSRGTLATVTLWRTCHQCWRPAATMIWGSSLSCPCCSSPIVTIRLQNKNRKHCKVGFSSWPDIILFLLKLAYFYVLTENGRPRIFIANRNGDASKFHTAFLISSYRPMVITQLLDVCKLGRNMGVGIGLFSISIDVCRRICSDFFCKAPNRKPDRRINVVQWCYWYLRQR